MAVSPHPTSLRSREVENTAQSTKLYWPSKIRNHVAKLSASLNYMHNATTTVFCLLLMVEKVFRYSDGMIAIEKAA